jgi:hypothetical protein
MKSILNKREIAKRMEVGDKQSKVWLKCFSVEHNSFYFFNTLTSEATWTEPEDGNYSNDELSMKIAALSLKATSTDSLEYLNDKDYYNDECYEEISPNNTSTSTTTVQSNFAVDLSNAIDPYPKVPKLVFNGGKTINKEGDDCRHNMLPTAKALNSSEYSIDDSADIAHAIAYLDTDPNLGPDPQAVSEDASDDSNDGDIDMNCPHPSAKILASPVLI